MIIVQLSANAISTQIAVLDCSKKIFLSLSQEYRNAILKVHLINLLDQFFSIRIQKTGKSLFIIYYQRISSGFCF